MQTVKFAVIKLQTPHQPTGRATEPQDFYSILLYTFFTDRGSALISHETLLFFYAWSGICFTGHDLIGLKEDMEESADWAGVVRVCVQAD